MLNETFHITLILYFFQVKIWPEYKIGETGGKIRETGRVYLSDFVIAVHYAKSIPKISPPILHGMATKSISET